MQMDESPLDTRASYRVVISQTILDALTYLQNPKAADFGESSATLQGVMKDRLLTGNLPQPVRYYQVEVQP